MAQVPDEPQIEGEHRRERDGQADQGEGLLPAVGVRLHRRDVWNQERLQVPGRGRLARARADGHPSTVAGHG